MRNAPTAGLPGRSRTITVTPVETPITAPVEPERESTPQREAPPEREPARVPEREKVPA